MVNLAELLKKVTDEIAKELEDTQLRVEGAQIGAIRMFEAIKEAIATQRGEGNGQQSDRSDEAPAAESEEVVLEQ